MRPANFQVLPKEKPAGTRRILCLGESTTAGFPFPAHAAFPALLQEILDERQPGANWEVTNLGVTALSASSVASFIDEALTVQPDALVIYLGHNEFYGVGGVVSGGARGAAAFDFLYGLRLFRVLERAFPGIARTESEESSRRRAAVSPGSNLRTKAFDNYRKQMEYILGAASKKNVPIVLCEVFSNERDLYPLGSPDSAADRGTPAWSAATAWGPSAGAPEHATESGYPSRESAAGALPDLDRQVASDSPDAGFRYLRGCARAAMGDPGALADFVEARNLDPIPFRAPDDINVEIRELAKRFGCRLVPMVEIMRTSAPGHVIGHESCVEHLHPTFLGNARIASAAADALIGSRRITEMTPALAGSLLRAAAITPVDFAFADARMDKLMHLWPYERPGDEAPPFPYSARSTLAEAHDLFEAAGDSAGAAATARLFDEVAQLLPPLEDKRINILDAHTRLAKRHEEAGDLAAAEWELEAAVRLFPVDFNIWVQLGRTRLDRGDARGAAEAARSALYWAPGFPPAEALLREAASELSK
ncbi:MAG: hypothetical protein R3E12_00315 [Candidatus Eisenbacteria bacterium]